MNKPIRTAFEITTWVSNGEVIATKDHKGLHIIQEHTTATSVAELDELTIFKQTKLDERAYQKAITTWNQNEQSPKVIL